MTPIVVVLAVYAPDERLLEEQVDSLAVQTHPISKVVVVVADKNSTDVAQRLCTEHGLTVDIVTPENTTPSVKSFEIGLARAVKIAPAHAVVALCDQDDIWHPEKLATSVRRLKETGAGLVHTDARVVGLNGDLQHQSLFRLERRYAAAGLRALLLRNHVTGMTVVMTRQVASASLPFPAQSALFFHHDLWLALVATVLGGVAYVSQPLVDYRQHGRNVVGAIDSACNWPRLGSKAWYRHWAGMYAVAAFLAKSLYLRIGDVAASGAAAPDRERLAELKPYLSRRSIGRAFLGDAAKLLVVGRFALALQSAMFFCVRFGRLGWAVRRTLRGGLMPALAEFDQRAFSMAPGAQPGTTDKETEITGHRLTASSFRETRVIRKFEISMKRSAQERVVILVPSLNPAEIFAGIATAIDIGIGLARRGQHVVFLATDLPIASRERSLGFVADRAGVAQGSALSRITVACGVTENAIEFRAQDRFLATAWWSAHMIREILGVGGFSNQSFYYLIQDFEPGFYPWGGEHAGALASYQFDFSPIFNSIPLQQYFEQIGLTRQANAALTFHPSIDLERYLSLERQTREKPRLVLYGRPEVARNMFGTALESLEDFLAREQLGADDIELISVGLPHPDVKMSGSHTLRSLGKIPWPDYPQFLSSVDVGLSLMLSPHPSHLPLEMAAAGAQVVTNKIASKDLGMLTPSIHSVDPSVSDISMALSKAWAAPLATASDRRFDLRQLGSPLEDVLDLLFDDIHQPKIKLAVAG